MVEAWHGRWAGSKRWRRRLVHAPLLGEALVELARAKWSIAARPFTDVVAVRPLGARRGDVATVCWALEAVSRRLPWRSLCFDRGLALQRLLRRRGHDARLHYGARQHGDRLEAHVWVSLGEALLAGGDEAAGFREMARYPA